MAREVICVKELSEHKAEMFVFEFGVKPPVKDNIYNVSGIFNIAGVTFLHLAEYPPPTFAQSIQQEIHLSFDARLFAELPDSLADDISEAVKAPAPMVRELEPVTFEDWDWQVKIKMPFFRPEPLTHLYL